MLSHYVNGASDIERIGDHSTNLTELYDDLDAHALKFSDQAMAEFNDMISTVIKAVRLSMTAVASDDIVTAREVYDTLEDQIDTKEKSLRQSHIQRLNEGICTPDAGIVFIDILSNLERVGDHAHNLALLVRDVVKMHGGNVETQK